VLVRIHQPLHLELPQVLEHPLIVNPARLSMRRF
jgi:hypothetical protein